FNFDEMVKDVKAMHEHYKLDGVYEGEPKFKYHDEFQASAKEAKKDDKK
ncbi:MAG: cytochrome C554, partial [Nitrosomonas halophila]